MPCTSTMGCRASMRPWRNALSSRCRATFCCRVTSSMLRSAASSASWRPQLNKLQQQHRSAAAAGTARELARMAAAPHIELAMRVRYSGAHEGSRTMKGDASNPGRFAITRARDFWYVACRSEALRQQPLARTLFDTPLVLFRDDAGRAATLIDRCAHRNVPLSAGRVVNGLLECGYHGWRYDVGGVCRTVPSLLGE